MKTKLRELLKGKYHLSPRIQNLFINKSYDNVTDTKIISLLLFLSEVAVFVSDISYYKTDLSSLDSQQKWISHASSCFGIYQVSQKK